MTTKVVFVNCREFKLLIDDILDDAVSGVQKRSVGLHLSRCPACRSYVEKIRKEHASWFRALNAGTDNGSLAKDEMVSRLVAELKASDNHRHLSGMRKGWLLVAASLVICLFGFLLISELRSSWQPDNAIRVELVDQCGMTDDELELYKARYASDRAFTRRLEHEFIKYEPGVVENPGAPIRVLENASDGQNGRHLRPKDRVWRETIEIADGFLRFEIGTNCIVTVNAPARVEIRDEFTFEIVYGSAFFDVKTMAMIGVGGQQITVSKASAGFVVPECGSWADMIVTDGVVKIGDEEFFKPRDGSRIYPDGRRLRYRSVDRAENLRGRILAGVRDVRIAGERGRYAL